MALEITPSGVTIQTQSEIAAERATELRDPAVLGPEFRPDDESTLLGRQTISVSEREARIQQALLTLVTNLNPNSAEGVHLDAIALIRGVVRESATFSESPDGQFVFTAAGTVPDGSRVRNDRTGEDWVVVGDVVAAGAGTESGTIRARETGPKSFLAADTWTITTPAVNWSTFDTVGDIDPEDTGQDRESDEDLLERSNLSLESDGYSIEAIIANVAQVTGVSYVGGFANRTNSTVDGVPGRAFEIVVEGGADADIHQAIYERLPPGSEPFGAVSGTVDLPDGTTLDVPFTRPSDVNIWLRITMTTGAEYDTAFDFATLVEAAVLAQAEADANPGVDVVPPSYQGIVWSTTADSDTGRPTLLSVLVEGSTDGVIWSTAPIALNHKQRPDFDSARISTVVI